MLLNIKTHSYMLAILIRLWKKSLIPAALLTSTFFILHLPIATLTLLSFLLWPISPKLYRFCTAKLYNASQSILSYALLDYGESTLKLYMSDRDAKYITRDTPLVICNHVGSLDWMIGLTLYDIFGNLEACRGYIKNQLLYVPFLGLCWYSNEYILLSRDWKKDQIAVKKQFETFCLGRDPIGQEPKEIEQGDIVKTPYSQRSCKFVFSIFVEGTRKTNQKLLDNQEYARNHNLTVYEHLLQPRHKGLWAARFHLANFPCRDMVVHDVTLAETIPCTIKGILGWCPGYASLHIERLPLNDIPLDEDGVKEWLRNRWAIKEKRLEYFHKHGVFEDNDHSYFVKNLKRTRPTALVTKICTIFYTLLLLVSWLTNLVNPRIKLASYILFVISQIFVVFCIYISTPKEKK